MDCKLSSACYIAGDSFRNFSHHIAIAIVPTLKRGVDGYGVVPTLKRGVDGDYSNNINGIYKITNILANIQRYFSTFPHKKNLKY
jgi:hypothetical protein